MIDTRVCVCVYSIISDSIIPWTVACQAPLSIGFSRQEYWSGGHFLFQGDLPNPGIKPVSPVLAGGFFTTEQPMEAQNGRYMSLDICSNSQNVQHQ